MTDSTDPTPTTTTVAGGPSHPRRGLGRTAQRRQRFDGQRVALQQGTAGPSDGSELLWREANGPSFGSGVAASRAYAVRAVHLEDEAAADRLLTEVSPDNSSTYHRSLLAGLPALTGYPDPELADRARGLLWARLDDKETHVCASTAYGLPDLPQEDSSSAAARDDWTSRRLTDADSYVAGALAALCVEAPATVPPPAVLQRLGQLRSKGVRDAESAGRLITAWEHAGLDAGGATEPDAERVFLEGLLSEAARGDDAARSWIELTAALGTARVDPASAGRRLAAVAEAADCKDSALIAAALRWAHGDAMDEPFILHLDALSDDWLALEGLGPRFVERPDPCLRAMRLKTLPALAGAIHEIKALPGADGHVVRVRLGQLPHHLLVALMQMQRSELRGWHLQPLLRTLMQAVDDFPELGAPLVSLDGSYRLEVDPRFEAGYVRILKDKGVKREAANLIDALLERVLIGEAKMSKSQRLDTTLRWLTYLSGRGVDHRVWTRLSDRAMAPCTRQVAAAMATVSAAGPSDHDKLLAGATGLHAQIDRRTPYLTQAEAEWALAIRLRALSRRKSGPSDDGLPKLRPGDIAAEAPHAKLLRDLARVSSDLGGRARRRGWSPAALDSLGDLLDPSPPTLADRTAAAWPGVLAEVAVHPLELLLDDARPSLRAVRTLLSGCAPDRRAGLLSICELDPKDGSIRLSREAAPTVELSGGKDTAALLRDVGLIASLLARACEKAQWRDLTQDWKLVVDALTAQELQIPGGRTGDPLELGETPLPACAALLRSLERLSVRITEALERTEQAVGTAPFGAWRDRLKQAAADLKEPYDDLRRVWESADLGVARAYLDQGCTFDDIAERPGRFVGHRRALAVLVRAFAHVEAVRGLVGSSTSGAEVGASSLLGWSRRGFAWLHGGRVQVLGPLAVALALVWAPDKPPAGDLCVPVAGYTWLFLVPMLLAVTPLLLVGLDMWLSGRNTQVVVPLPSGQLAFPRLWAANTLGLTFFAVSDEVVTHTLAVGGALVPVAATAAAMTFLFFWSHVRTASGTHRRGFVGESMPRPGVRARRIWLHATNQTLTLLLVAHQISGATMHQRVKEHGPFAEGIDGVPVCLELLGGASVNQNSLLLWATAGVFLGVLLQALWEERPLSEGLG